MELVYPPVIATARVLFGALGLRLTVEGDEHVPTSGPVVLVSNHVSFLDFLLVGLAARRSRRYVRFLARHDLWGYPVARGLMTGMRHVPVDREAPAAAYLRARSMLYDGEVVGIFPEAGISTSFTVRALMPGAVALAAETGVPLVPMALWGPQRIATAHTRFDLHRGRPVSIKVAEPIHVPRGSDVRNATRALGGVLQSTLDDLQTRDRHRPTPGEPAPWQPAHLGGQAPSAEAARYLASVPSSAVPASWLPGSATRLT